MADTDGDGDRPAPAPPRTIRLRTAVAWVLIVCTLSAGIATLVPSVMREESPTTLEAAFDAPRTSYTPVAHGNGVTVDATWRGNFTRFGNIGVLSITGRATGPWSGSGFLELSLPKGWKAQRTQEAATITGWAGPNPSIGVHWALIGVVHPGATRLRFIAPSPAAPDNAWLAVDGVTTPGQFSGSLSRPKRQTEIHAVGWVLLAR